MYLALKPIKYRKDDLTVGDVSPGQEVPGFDSWNVWTKKGMIDQKYVRWSESGQLAPHEVAAAERKVVQPLPRGPLGPVHHEAEKVREPSFYKSALPEIRAAVVDSGVIEAPEPVDNSLLVATAAKPADGRVVVDIDPNLGNGGGLSCTACGRTGFKDANGLRVHQARIHKDIV